MSTVANWNYPTRVFVGAGRIVDLPAACLQQGITNPLIVTDPGIAVLPMFEAITELFSEGAYGTFSDLKLNPTGDNVKAGVKAFARGKHDGVVAVGGGSALDVGKAVALMARQEFSLWELEDEGDNWRRATPALIAPVIAVPTTAGTGSEVGRASLITNETERRKVIVFHPMMLPVTVILDPELTVGLPPHLTAATGMDALSHNLEAYCSPLFHPMAEGIALEGMRTVKENLEVAVANGQDVQARLNMLVASLMGATAFQKGLGAMHALAHPLGAVYDAHHGLLNAVLMPYVLRTNVDVIRERIERLSGYLGLAKDFDAFVEWILALRENVGIPHTLQGIVETDAMFDSIGVMASGDPSAATNPVQLSAAQYQRLVQRAVDGQL